MRKSKKCVTKQFDAIRNLDKKQLLRAFASESDQVFKRGQILFAEGEVLGGVYYVKEGVCKLSKLSCNGKLQIVSLITKGDLLGVRSLVSKEATNLTAQALTTVYVAYISKEAIFDALKSNPDFSLDVVLKLASRLRESDTGIVNMAHKSVKKRLADALLYIKVCFGENEEGMLNLILTREDYANMIGAATAMVIRVFSYFRESGLITTEGKQIKVENAVALSNVL